VTADQARALTRKAVKAAADAQLVEANLDRWFGGIRAAAQKGASFFLFEVTPGAALDECCRQMQEAGFVVGEISPGPSGTVLVETSW